MRAKIKALLLCHAKRVLGPSNRRPQNLKAKLISTMEHQRNPAFITLPTTPAMMDLIRLRRSYPLPRPWTKKFGRREKVKWNVINENGPDHQRLCIRPCWETKMKGSKCRLLEILLRFPTAMMVTQAWYHKKSLPYPEFPLYPEAPKTCYKRILHEQGPERSNSNRMVTAEDLVPVPRRTDGLLHTKKTRSSLLRWRSLVLTNHRLMQSAIRRAPVPRLCRNPKVGRRIQLACN
mmetsp:Transcript_20401/g.44169  ORF Transcript_20401/g.44169 Transcript_20401/m.44169 type:complete len:234 (-) Transcript_20401:1005-1706(-)